VTGRFWPIQSTKFQALIGVANNFTSAIFSVESEPVLQELKNADGPRKGPSGVKRALVLRLRAIDFWCFYCLFFQNRRRQRNQIAITKYHP